MCVYIYIYIYIWLLILSFLYWRFRGCVGKTINIFTADDYNWNVVLPHQSIAWFLYLGITARHTCVTCWGGRMARLICLASESLQTPKRVVENNRICCYVLTGLIINLTRFLVALSIFSISLRNVLLWKNQWAVTLYVLFSLLSRNV
jgi:hypothetical protein